jgi:hypothetical protein
VDRRSDHRLGIVGHLVGAGERRRAAALVSVDSAVELATSPQLIDSGRTLLFTLRQVAETGPEASSIVVQAIGGGSRKMLMRAGRRGIARPSRHRTSAVEPARYLPTAACQFKSTVSTRGVRPSITSLNRNR